MRTISIIVAVTLLAACSGRSRQAPVTNPPTKQQPAPTPSQEGGGPVTIDGDQGSSGDQGSGGEQINGGSTGAPPPNDDAETPDSETPSTTTTGGDNTLADPNKPAEPVVTPEAKPETTPTPTTPTTPNATGSIDVQGTAVLFQDLKFSIPEGWKLHQDTNTNGVMLMGFSKGNEYFRIYAKKSALPSLQTVFVNGSQVVGQERDEKVGDHSWKRIDTQKGQVSVAGFALSYKDHAYYGFARSGSQQTAAAIAAQFLGGMK